MALGFFFPEEQEHKIYMRLTVHPLQNCLSNCGNKKCYLGIIFEFSHFVALTTEKEEVTLYKIPPKSLTELCSEKHLLQHFYLAHH